MTTYTLAPEPRGQHAVLKCQLQTLASLASQRATAPTKYEQRQIDKYISWQCEALD